MSQKLKVELQDENGNIYYLHTAADVVFLDDGTTVEAALEKKVNASGGDISNTKLATLAAESASFPVPAAGDAPKTLWGKAKKWQQDCLAKFANYVLTSAITNQYLNDTSKIPTAALMYLLKQEVNGLNSELDDIFNPGVASGDSGKFTQYLSDFLSPDKYGLQFDVRILDNHEEDNIYAPPHGDYENGINWGYYIVFTFGERSQNSIYHRIHQIAFNPFNHNTGRFYMRVQHDENVTDWFSYGDNKRLFQNPDGPTAIQSISPVSGTLYRLQISETGTVKVYKSVDNGQSWTSKDVFSYENS